jgi:hypothetical protein
MGRVLYNLLVGVLYVLVGASGKSIRDTQA